MLLTAAYRSLPRLSSLLKPIHPLAGLASSLYRTYSRFLLWSFAFLPTRLHERPNCQTNPATRLCHLIHRNAQAGGVTRRTASRNPPRLTAKNYTWTRRDFRCSGTQVSAASAAFRTRDLLLAKQARYHCATSPFDKFFP